MGMGTSRFVVTEYDLAVMRYLVRAARKSLRELSASSSLEAISEVFHLGVVLIRSRVRRGRHRCVTICRGGLCSRTTMPAQLRMIRKLWYLRKVTIVRCGLEDVTGLASI